MLFRRLKILARFIVFLLVIAEALFGTVISFAAMVTLKEYFWNILWASGLPLKETFAANALMILYALMIALGNIILAAIAFLITGFVCKKTLKVIDLI